MALLKMCHYDNNVAYFVKVRKLGLVSFNCYDDSDDTHVAAGDRLQQTVYSSGLIRRSTCDVLRSTHHYIMSYSVVGDVLTERDSRTSSVPLARHDHYFRLLNLFFSLG